MSMTEQQIDVTRRPSHRATTADWVSGGGHSYYWTARRFLYALSDYRKSLSGARFGEPLPTTWLLPFRKDFRQMISDNTMAAIDWHVRTGDPTLRSLYLWLLRRHAD